MFYLGIDSGTQSTKCVVLDGETGQIVAQKSESYGLIPGLPEGHLEQDPAVWVDAMRKTVAGCLSELGARRSEVRGVAISGQQHGLVVLDERDRVVRPAKLWCDTSTASQCRKFEEAFGGVAGLIQKAGNAMLPGYTAPKVLWIKENEPENFARVQSILLPHDYLNFRLTGVKQMEYGDASGTGFLNVRTRTWEADLVRFVDDRVMGMLPPLGSSRQPHGELCEDLRKEWDLPSGVMVGAGGGDNMMGAIGTGNIRPGTITASLGTSGTLYACAGQPVVDPKGEVAAFCDSTDQWLPLVCTMNVTVTTEQVRSLFGWSLERLEEAVRRAEPGAGGITFLPYLNGERTPNLPNGSGVLHGLKTGNLKPENLARAAMEGATLGLAYGLKRFRELGVQPTEIRLTGGGSKSAIWRQIAADVFGVPVVTLATAEGAALGAAIQAAHASSSAQGKEASFDSLCEKWVALDDATRVQPDPARSALYAGLLDRLTGLTRTMAGAGWL